jgi:hypothetical protein
MNEDDSTFEIPDYIMSRLQPTLTLSFPSRDDELEILRYHLPFAGSEMLSITVNFLQKAHKLDLDFSPRDGINIIRYGLKRLAQDPEHPLAIEQVWAEAVTQCLGRDAHDLERLALARRSAMGEMGMPLGLGDFFHDPNAPMHPDYDDEDSEF